MKIQCNVCGVAEANVLCCADEAALCRACDEKVHAANKLASKHQRVSLFGSSSPMPKCDICQEAVGYFFCLEDRALLCQKCDVAIHTVNTYVASHQRFLITGVKAELEPNEPGASSSSVKAHVDEKNSETEPHFWSKNGNTMLWDGSDNKELHAQVDGVGNFPPTKLSLAGGSVPGNIPQWPLDEFVGLTEFNQTYGYSEDGSSKADSGKLGDSDNSPILRAGELDFDECFGQVPDASWTVPQFNSPPTASGLNWPKICQNLTEAAAFVPDVCWSPLPNSTQLQPSGASSKVGGDSNQLSLSWLLLLLCTSARSVL